MSEESIYHLELIIDDLTNSIRHIKNGDSFDTDIVKAAMEDLKVTTKKNGWHFSWQSESKKIDRTVYKLFKVEEPGELQGLISLSELEGYVYVHLAESAPINFGLDKVHEGVGGNLFAFACRKSWDNGNQGFVSFQAKTKLIPHYEKVLGAIHIGGHNMIIYPQEALFLIKRYYKV